MTDASSVPPRNSTASVCVPPISSPSTAGVFRSFDTYGLLRRLFPATDRRARRQRNAKPRRRETPPALAKRHPRPYTFPYYKEKNRIDNRSGIGRNTKGEYVRDQPTEDIHVACPAFRPHHRSRRRSGRQDGDRYRFRPRPDHERGELLVFRQNRPEDVSGPRTVGKRSPHDLQHGARAGRQRPDPHAAHRRGSRRSPQRLRHGPQPRKQRGRRHGRHPAPAVPGRAQGRACS